MMMITENNYEEYFLLYTDNELNEAERSSVEAFVQQHPQYQAALDAFLQTKLQNEEDVFFVSKNSLYKNADNEIGIDNYEDYFLLYTDNELSEKEIENTERFVLQHPQLQQEFTLLQQTKLPMETIAYPGKEELCKEEKRRRIIPFYIVRMSVAAAVTGVIAFAWQLHSSSTITATNQPVNVIAVAAKKSSVQSVQPSVLSQQIQPSQPSDSATQQATVLQIQSKATEDKITAFAKTTGSHEIKAKTEVAIAPVTIIHDKPITLAPPETAMQTGIASANNNTETKTVSELKPLDVSDEETNTQTAFSLSDDDSQVQPAVYKELQTDDATETLYVGVLQLNKAKVNGFLKSASHLFGSRTKQNAE